MDVREAFATELNEAHGSDYQADDILVSSGAKHSLFNLFSATINAGDEFIVPAPYWVSYPSMIELAGGHPVIVDTKPDDDFMLHPAALKAAITPKTRGIIINSPSNPTGSVYTKERLTELAAICLEKQIFVVADDIYRNLVYGDTKWVSMLRSEPKLKESLVIVDGVSKSYAMTGWRIGYAAGPRHIIKAMAKLQGQSTSNASHLSQVAAMAAVSSSQGCVIEMLQQFDKRRTIMVQLLRDIPNVTCTMPHGAFYAFPDLNHYIGMNTPEGKTIQSDVELASFLVEAAEVALVPGSAFGAPGFARLSYACSVKDIETGIKNLSEALSKLS